MNPLAITMFSQKKLNTYGVESPCECFPRVARYARQPWAIKRTTRTELRGYNIRNDGFTHGNAGIISTVLYRCNIRNYGFIHGNADIISTALRFFNFISFKRRSGAKDVCKLTNPIAFCF